MCWAAGELASGSLEDSCAWPSLDSLHEPSPPPGQMPTSITSLNQSIPRLVARHPPPSASYKKGNLASLPLSISSISFPPVSLFLAPHPTRFFQRTHAHTHKLTIQPFLIRPLYPPNSIPSKETRPKKNKKKENLNYLYILIPPLYVPPRATPASHPHPPFPLFSLFHLSHGYALRSIFFRVPHSLRFLSTDPDTTTTRVWFHVQPSPPQNHFNLILCC